MFDSEKPDVYEKVYLGLVERLAGVDFAGAAASLGLERQGAGCLVPLLGGEYLVGPTGVSLAEGGKAFITHRIVLAWYLLHAGSGEPSGSMVPYRELPGGADFARALQTLVHQRLAEGFAGRLAQLKRAAASLGAEELESSSPHDGAWRFAALPKLPLELRFYDADDEFPAEAKVLYDLTAPNFLDLECLAALAHILVLELERAARNS
ncbi:DUF3786 domain-containing protein [Desulfoferula mesophila]|uniref:DUF3786 domain-containing protein n=1 Tax=Desulfoferula mesophila TaxID=3058419 RepID=UPI0030D1D5A8